MDGGGGGVGGALAFFEHSPCNADSACLGILCVVNDDTIRITGIRFAFEIVCWRVDLVTASVVAASVVGARGRTLPPQLLPPAERPLPSDRCYVQRRRPAGMSNTERRFSDWIW